VTIDTYPWTKVSIDGLNVGSTPIVNLSLAAGNHSVTMSNTEENVSKTVQIVVKSGRVTSLRFSLGK
jgi:eukaryotic-like serine/threonine-protein kinase